MRSWTDVVAGRVALKLWADQRGAVALEMPFVFIFMLFSLLFPMADVAIAGFRFISAFAALRGFGEYLQFHIPPDIPTWNGTWSSGLPTTVGGYPISGVQVICGDTNAVCSSGNTASPKSFSYSTTVTLSPMVLSAVLCNPSCTHTLSSSERFQ